MFILYIDGSGSVGNPRENHFVLAGVAVHEGQIFRLIPALDNLVESLELGPADEVELHGSHMYGGRGQPWRSIDRDRRLNCMHQTLGVLTNSANSTRAFGVVVNKQAVSPRDSVEYAFEEICNRFDLYLSRMYHARGGRNHDRQKGLIVMDEPQY